MSSGITTMSQFSELDSHGFSYHPGVHFEGDRFHTDNGPYGYSIIY